MWLDTCEGQTERSQNNQLEFWDGSEAQPVELILTIWFGLSNVFHWVFCTLNFCYNLKVIKNKIKKIQELHCLSSCI